MNEFRMFATPKYAKFVSNNKKFFLYSKIGQILTDEYGMEMEHVISRGRMHYILVSDCKTGKMSALMVKVVSNSCKGYVVSFGDWISVKDALLATKNPKAIGRMLLAG